MTRRAAKIDANQTEIVEVLRAMGCKVQSLAGVGNGCPDLLVRIGGRNLLFEIKDGSEGFTPAQKRWHAEWTDAAQVVRTVDDAIAIVRYWAQHRLGRA